MHVNFYTKRNCSLCKEAELMMQLVQEDFPLTWTAIDIEENDKLHEKYMLKIPVIANDDDELLYGMISYIDLVELFE